MHLNLTSHSMTGASKNVPTPLPHTYNAKKIIRQVIMEYNFGAKSHDL